jgi:hypothetical protein
VFGAPPNSSKDSNASPKVKIKEEEKIKVRSFICNTLSSKKGRLELWDGD